jgi:hypothetical protein
MMPDQRLNAANEINALWVRHLRYSDAPPDAETVARILERHEVSANAGTTPPQLTSDMRPKLVLPKLEVSDQF